MFKYKKYIIELLEQRLNKRRVKCIADGFKLNNV